MEDKKEEKKTQAKDKDREHEEVKAEKKSQVMEKEREDEGKAEQPQAGGSKASPQIRSTMIREEAKAEARDKAGPKERASAKQPLTTQFAAIWGLLNTSQLVMVALVI